MTKLPKRVTGLFAASLITLGISGPAHAREGGLNQLILHDTLRGTGPNGSLTFSVEYRAYISFQADEFRRIGRRYCRWSFSGNRVERVIFVQRAGGTEEVREGRRGESKANPAPDETADNCNSVIDNSITPMMTSQASRENWAAFIAEDAARVREIIGNPLP